MDSLANSVKRVAGLRQALSISSWIRGAPPTLQWYQSFCEQRVCYCALTLAVSHRSLSYLGTHLQTRLLGSSIATQSADEMSKASGNPSKKGHRKPTKPMERPVTVQAICGAGPVVTE